MVVVASGNKEDLKAILPSVQKYYTVAYVKTASVYMGCMQRYGIDVVIIGKRIMTRSDFLTQYGLN